MKSRTSTKEKKEKRRSVLTLEYLRYESKRITELSLANNADFKPTYEPEITSLKKDLRRYYENGRQLQKRVGPAALRQCKAYALMRGVSEYETDYLEQFIVEDMFVVAPAYLRHYEDFILAKKLFAKK